MSSEIEKSYFLHNCFLRIHWHTGMFPNHNCQGSNYWRTSILLKKHNNCINTLWNVVGSNNNDYDDDDDDNNRCVNSSITLINILILEHPKSNNFMTHSLNFTKRYGTRKYRCLTYVSCITVSSAVSIVAVTFVWGVTYVVFSTFRVAYRCIQTHRVRHNKIPSAQHNAHTALYTIHTYCTTSTTAARCSTMSIIALRLSYCMCEGRKGHKCCWLDFATR